MSIAQEQYDALELARYEKFVANGQPGDLLLLRYSGNALASYLTLSNAWDYGDRMCNGTQLPPDVLYELRFHESLLSASDAKYIAAVQHNGIIYQIIRPSPIPPTGINRFWRFWITPQENTTS